MEAFTSFRLPISPYSNFLSYFGRTVGDRSDLDISVISSILQSPTGFQWNPNNLAVTMLIISPFFLLHKNKYVKYLGVFSILVLIIMAGSRGVFISFVFMLFLYMFFLNKKRFIIYSSIVPLLLILFLTNLESLKASKSSKVREIASSFDVLYTYVFEDKKDRGDSIGIRQTLVKNGLEALKKSNYIGVGGGGSVAVQENAGGKIGKVASMHNFWVEMLVDSGVLFTVVFGMWYLYIIVKLYLIGIGTKISTYKYYSQSLFLAMSAFILGAVSASSVIYIFPMWIMFGFAIATINNYKRKIINETTTLIRP